MHRVKLATVPLLTKVLSPDSLTILVGRKLLPGSFPPFDGLLQLCRQQQVPLLVLWPGPGGVAAAAAAARGSSSSSSSHSIGLAE